MSEELPYVNVGKLKNLIKDLPDELDVFIQKVGGIGNVANVDSVRKSHYSFMGVEIPCLILDCKGEYSQRNYNDKEELNKKE